MGRPKSTLTTEQRFLQYVEKTDDCWLWTGAIRNRKIKRGGYGVFYIDGKNLISSRVAYELWIAPIDEGMKVRHKCDNRKCVNPDHLEIGTHQDNMDDMKSRGRQSKQNGENHGNHKLTNDDIFEMKILNGFGFTNVEIAKRFSISDGMVCMILKGKRWGHI
jgi:hypothetical protein